MSKDKQEDFQKRAKNYIQDVEKAGKKYNILARPIITQYGPDLQLADLLQQAEKKELIEKV